MTHHYNKILYVVQALFYVYVQLMRYRSRRHPRVVNSDLIQRRKATDFLYEQMLFWENEGKKLVSKVYDLVYSRSGIEASRLLREFSDINNRAIDVAAKLAPYQSAKRASIDVKTTNVKQFVIVAPRVINSADDWYRTIQKDQKLLPKPIKAIDSYSSDQKEASNYE